MFQVTILKDISSSPPVGYPTHLVKYRLQIDLVVGPWIDDPRALVLEVRQAQ